MAVFKGFAYYSTVKVPCPEKSSAKARIVSVLELRKLREQLSNSWHQLGAKDLSTLTS